MRLLKSRQFIAIILLLAIFFILPKATQANSGIVINEIMYDLAGNDATHEWIELFNEGTTEIDITGWKFNDGDNATNHGLNAPPQNASRGSLIIPPGGYLILTGNASTTIQDLSDYIGSIIDTVMTLANTSSTLKILDKDGTETATVAYDKEMGAAGNGKTLEWDGTIFKESLTDDGTPGASNSVLSQSPPSPPETPPADLPTETPTSTPQTTTPSQPVYLNFSEKVLLNEFLPNPPTDSKEWVEILSADTQTIDLSEWQIIDAAGNTQKIPAGTLIAPGGFFVLELSRSILNNEGDQINLLWSSSQTIHSVSYAKAEKDQALARFENNLWIWTDNITPGQTNKRPTISAAPPTTEIPTLPPAEKTQILPETTSSPPTPPSALVEQASQTSQPSNSADKKLAKTAPDPEPSAAQSAAQDGPIQDQPTQQNQLLASASSRSGNPFLFLGAVIVLSLLSGFALVFFRRKIAVDRS